MVSRINGSLRDKGVIFVLRFLFLCSILLLLFSSKFETSYRNYLQSKFLYLLDDSFSNGGSIEEKVLEARLNSLKGVLDISKKSFSDGDSNPLYSISKQLNHYAQSGEYRAIFLQSDGLEIEQIQRVDLGIPIFTIPSKKTNLKSIYLRVKQAHHRFSKNQKVELTLELSKNFEELQAGFIQVYLDDKELESKGFELSKRKLDLDFQLNIPQVGLHKLTFQLKSPDHKVQSLDYFVEIVEKEKNILVVSKNINADLSMYLRALAQLDSVNVYTHYLDFSKESIPKKSMDLLFVYDLSADELSKLSNLFSLKDVAKVFLFSQSKEMSDFKEIPLNGFSKLSESNVHLKGELSYQLKNQNFAPFRLFEHSAYEKDLMSSLNLLKNVDSKVVLPRDWEPVFSMVGDQDQAPLIAINRHLENASAMIFASKLSSLIFSPLYHKAQKDFFDRLVKNLFSWVLDFDRLQGLEIESGAQNSVEGNRFHLKITSNDQIQIVLKNLENSKIILEQEGPLLWNQCLSRGNYALEISSSKGLIERKLFHVSLDPREIGPELLNINYLKSLADLSGGKLLSSNVQDLSGYIPFQLKEKKLELVRKEVDLQENQYYLFFMIFLLCFEWIYRFQRRLV
ncbi:hypothetical protein MJH12_03645 [bacterium]|nr:hypothetical protein [bacterium]